MEFPPFKPEECSPEKNPKAIVVIEQADGNWKGQMQRFGKLVQIRAISPGVVIERLLTHNGKT